MKGITFVDIAKLRAHEEINQNRLHNVMLNIKQSGFLKNPVLVENKHFIILDGHHRVAALKQLGVNKVPVLLVNYQNNNIRVTLRRKNLKFDNIKQIVIRNVLSNRLFPCKTTKHLIRGRPKNINIKISYLLNKLSL